jgi:hypothetical protein
VARRRLRGDVRHGETLFGRWSVTPETGMALLFRHEIEHAGASVVSGTKYVLEDNG